MPQVVSKLSRCLRLAVMLSLGGAIGLVAPARADDFLNRVNGPFLSIPSDRRSETLIIPVLAGITEPPGAVATAKAAAMLPADAGAFPAAAEWAQADPQKAFLAVLPQITGEEDPKKAFAFAQLYGLEGVEPDHVSAGAYTNLGDPPLLAMARHLYLPMMDRADCLVQVEATRLAAAGNPKDALDLLWRWLHFARSMCDRQFYAEVTWGLKSMALSLERMRDITYTDSRLDKPLLDAQFVASEIAAKRLRDRGGYLALDGMEFPPGDGIACQQLINRVFKPRGDPDTTVFSPMLAGVSASNRPLRMFSETARWDSIAKLHAKELEASAMVRNVSGDWSMRWRLRPFDPMHRLRTDWDKMDKIKGAIIAVSVDNLQPIFEMRHRMRVELAGTRMALATQAYVLGQKVNPPALGALIPIYIPKGRERDNADPYTIKVEPFQYFVPVRDAVKNPINPVTFHEINVFPGDTAPAFAKRLDETHFVIYSVGPDGAPQGARMATQLVENDKGDFLIWPPVMSLLREHLQAEGIIK